MEKIASSLMEFKYYTPTVFCGHSYKSVKCTFLEPCSEVTPYFEPLSLQLGGSWQFNVSSEDYLIDSID